MEQATRSTESDDEGKVWSESQAMELWTYFGGVGATDKNTMVTVGSWLLGFSASIAGYLVVNVISIHPLFVKEPYQGIFLALLGLIISWVAVYVSLLYGGYTNWNWAKADAIARDQTTRYPKWKELLPENSKAVVSREPTPKLSFFCARAARFGQPCDPTTELAPVFSLYAWLALCAALFHGLTLLLSVWSLAGTRLITWWSNLSST